MGDSRNGSQHGVGLRDMLVGKYDLHILLLHQPKQSFTALLRDENDVAAYTLGDKLSPCLIGLLPIEESHKMEVIRIYRYK